MSQDKFKTFVDNLKQRNAPDPNMGEKKDKWLAAINDLYQRIDNWLKPYSLNISIKYFDIPISEELFGTYKTQRMDIQLAGNTVSLLPIGLFVIGAQGRIDMIGRNSTKRLVRLPQDITEFKVRFNVPTEQLEKEKQNFANSPVIWKFASIPPRITYTDVTEVTFKDALEELF